MYSQKVRLISLNLVLVMLLTIVPVQAADIVIDDDGPMYTVVLNGGEGTYKGDNTLSISYGSSTLYLEDYIFTREGYTLLGWSENEDASTLDYTRFGELYAKNAGKDSQLYAVWGEGENCALYRDEPVNIESHQVGKYYVADSDTLPADDSNKLIGWADHDKGFHKVGEAATAGEIYEPVYRYNAVLLDGNGGKSNFNAELFYAGSPNSKYLRTTVMARGKNVSCYSKDGYLLTGWEDSSGNLVVVEDNVVGAYPAAENGVVTLYARWSKANQLGNGVRLVIDGDDMTELLDRDDSFYGNGWRFYPESSDLRIYGDTYYGDAIAYDGDLNVLCSGEVAASQIEANGNLYFWSSNSDAELTISTDNIPAIHAKSVTFSDKISYRITAENTVGVDASLIRINCANVTITGDPAVRADAKIICGSGIDYKVSEDGRTLTTFAIENKITLDGNGGTFDGQKTVDTNYDVNNKLDLSKYVFTREGYALIGWATDANGSNFVTEHDGKISGASYPELYAVWLKTPEKYAIFQTWNDASLANYIDSYSDGDRWRTYYSVALTDDFVIPSITQNDSKESTIWQNEADHNLFYGGEIYTPASGSSFRLEESSANLDDGHHIIVLDGNGGTFSQWYSEGGTGRDYNINRDIVGYNEAAGTTVNYACDFTRPGYELVSYNSEPDGSGTEYALNKCTVTADMEPIQILYAQWKEISADEPYISIDGKKYSAERSSWGDGWQYTVGSNFEHLFLTGYQGGNIEANVDLWITSSKKSAVTGSISAPNLTINVQEGSLSVTSAEGSALRATGELNISCNGEGAFEASGDPTALSCSELIKDGYQTYLIRGGADKEHAEQITNDTFDNLSYISYERRDRVLTLHGNGGTTTDEKDTCTVSSKNSIIDLTAYAQTFTNGGRRLLGWSRQADASTIDYAAASDVSYSFNYWYEFKGDIYAVWEDDDRKGIVLNDYGYYTGQRYENNGSTLEYYRYAQQYTLPVSGETFTLPDSYRAGYTFTGWLGSDSKIYQAGAAIKIPTALSFTAQYTAGVIIVGGKAYSADRAQGSRELGWTYEPDRYTRYPSGYSTLRIYENYSGAPIQADGNLLVILSTNNDLTAPEGQPMIEVTGDLRIQTDWYTQGGVSKPYTTKLAGGTGAPAVKATGTLHLGSPVTLVGGEGKPAMEVKALDAGYAFLTGASETEVERAGTYKNEHYFRMDLAAPAIFQPGNLIPQMPDTDTHRFVGWREDASNGTVWYLAGDTFEGAEKTMSASYISKDMRVLALDGNGGATSDGQKYFVKFSSDSDLRLTAETAQSAFHRDGYALAGYNTDRDGDGTGYTAQQLAALVSGTAAAGVQTFFAQWTRNSNPVTPEKPSKPTTPTQPTTPDGSADITVSGSTVKVENVDVDKLVTDNGDKKTAEIDLSGTKSGITDVTLPTDAVKELAASEAESLTVKLPDVTVSFDDKALAAVAEQSSGTDLSLSVNVGAANNSNLTDAQKNAITGARELSVIEVSLSSNGEKISNFNGGSVTIDVPFQWSMKGLLRAYYIDENGNKSAIDVTYKNGVATLVLNHFSTYVVEAVDALSFTDVSTKAYYFDAVAWAVKNKITSGQSDTLFAPDASCTRAQMVTFLWRANGSPEPTVTELPFTDVAADAYYAKAVLWAVENGITTGTSDTTFDPDGVVTRAEAVTFLWRAAGKPIAGGSLFADVESTKYYAEAVRWAVTSGITNGMSDLTFAPNDICTRAHIVTFLYRAYRSK